MAQSFVCPQGHQWEDTFDGGLSLVGERSVACPVCGTLTEVGPESSATRPPSLLHKPTEPPAPASEDVADTATHGAVPEFVAPNDAPPVAVAGYVIMSELGRGGMGVVYKARQVGLKRTVALKMVLAGAHSSPDAIARFKAEAEAVALLQHPDIVQIYKIGEHARRPYFSMEFVEGGSLNDVIYDNPMPVKQCARVVAAMARAMHVVHQHGVVHRDLKPANVLLTRDGTPKITDFGLAKNLGDVAGQTRTGDIMGTPSYMAPEQAEGRLKEIGPATDVYALGAILYEMLTARPPFKAETAMDTLLQVLYEEPMSPAFLLPNLPRDVETICLKCLNKEIGKRYATALELGEGLERFVDGRPILARRVSRFERVSKWAKRRPAVAALLALSIVAPLCLLVLSLAFNWRLNDLNDQLKAAAEGEQRKAEEAETQRARAVHQEGLATRRREEAEVFQKVAEQQRRRAEQNFRKAREATRLLLSEVAATELANAPLMEDVRQRLLTRAVEFNTQFLETQSNDPSVRQQAGLAYQQLGEIYRMLGNYPKSEDAHREGLKRFQALTTENATEADFSRDLGISQFQLGQLFRTRSQYQEAEDAYRDALMIQEKLAKEFPKNPDYRFDVAHTANDLALVLSLTERREPAEELYKRAIALQRTLVNEHPDTNPNYREGLAGSCNDLGKFLRGTQPGKAEESYGEALKQFRELVTRYPQMAIYRQKLASTLNNLGNILNDQHGPARAADPLREALSYRQQLVKDFPLIVAYRQELASTHNSLAVLLTTDKKYDDAEKECNLALDIQRKLVKDFPDLPDFQAQLAAMLDNLAAVYLRQDRLDQAQLRLAESRPLHDKLNPDQAQYRQLRRNHFVTLTDTLLKIVEKEPAKHGETAKAAAEFVKLADDRHGDHFRAAVALTRCMVLVAKDAKLVDAERKRLTDDYAGLAVQSLRRALQLGWDGRVALKTDPFFTALRGRADFQKLLAEAETEPK